MHRSREIRTMWPSMSAEREVMGWGVSRGLSAVWSVEVRRVLVRQQSNAHFQSSRPEKKQRINVRMFGTWIKNTAGLKDYVKVPNTSRSKLEVSGGCCSGPLNSFSRMRIPQYTRLPGAQWGSRPRGYLLVTNFCPRSFRKHIADFK